MPARPFVLAALAIASAGGSQGAVAWDADTREAIVAAAFRMSPAAEARVPTEHRDRILLTVREGDGTGTASCFQRGEPGTPQDPVEQAAALLASILEGRAGDRPYKRANTYGRLLFYLSELAVPEDVLRNPCIDPATFVNKNTLLFRERRPLSGLSAGDLRNRATAGGRAGISASGLSASVRFSANLVADVLLRLPVLGRKDAADDGPSIWILNSVDDGRGGRPSAGSKSSRRKSPAADPGSGPSSARAGPIGAVGTQLIGISERLGLLVLEWVSGAEASSVRVLLVNNDSTCATQVVLKHGASAYPVPGTFAPWEARVVELRGPADVDPMEVRGTFKSFECSAGPSYGGASTRRRVKALAVRRPDLDGREVEASQPRSSTGFGGLRDLRD